MQHWAEVSKLFKNLANDVRNTINTMRSPNMVYYLKVLISVRQGCKIFKRKRILEYLLSFKQVPEVFEIQMSKKLTYVPCSSTSFSH